MRVEWADEPMRTFETGVLVTVRNGKGVLARWPRRCAATPRPTSRTSTWATSRPQDSTELRFVISVRDRAAPRRRAARR